jgi:hypothetical protein
VRIYNVLPQWVATPILQGGGDNAGKPVENLQLSCGGDYKAFWDGTYRGTSQQVASGVYYVRLEVDGKPVASRQMLVLK